MQQITFKFKIYIVLSYSYPITPNLFFLFVFSGVTITIAHTYY